MRFRFVWIGKTRDPLFCRLEERYLKRIGNHFSTRRATVSEQKKHDPRQQAAQFEREAREIEKQFSPGMLVVVLHPGGRLFSSPQLASFLRDRMDQGLPGMIFVLGGHLGIPPRIEELADLKWSLTPMTLPHELSRVVFLEQIYRAVSIVKGLSYHH